MRRELRRLHEIRWTEYSDSNSFDAVEGSSEMSHIATREFPVVITRMYKME